ncbi:HNH endonuclease signature motif containing protein [Salicibibacter cibi]|uniref:HNH endonuclease signature motif containing protein n=1 Tax=Salicibibacter cibi TaxID=2743001 RepID=UPI001FE9812B|nr:HNH endonuclease signature motif containing protein [Salicibibacter cibi]
MIEVAQFDTQKIKKPSISRDLYQKGDQLGLLLECTGICIVPRQSHMPTLQRKIKRCLNVHHIDSRKMGGDSPDNLICLYETCHKMIHQEGKEHLFKRQTPSLRDAS